MKGGWYGDSDPDDDRPAPPTALEDAADLEQLQRDQEAEAYRKMVDEYHAYWGDRPPAPQPPEPDWANSITGVWIYDDSNTETIQPLKLGCTCTRDHGVITTRDPSCSLHGNIGSGALEMLIHPDGTLTVQEATPTMDLSTDPTPHRGIRGYDGPQPAEPFPTPPTPWDLEAALHQTLNEVAQLEALLIELAEKLRPIRREVAESELGSVPTPEGSPRLMQQQLVVINGLRILTNRVHDLTLSVALPDPTAVKAASR